MSTTAPVKREYDIPIVKPEEAPRRLNPGIAVPDIVMPVRVPEYVPVRGVPEYVPLRREI